MKNKQKNKLYIKATKYYENGEIDKALKICEEGMTDNLKDASIINLKGLLLYLKGDLEGAVAAWKINSDFNDDPIAKSYIGDSKSDYKRLESYKKSIKLIKDLNIDEAISELNTCLESDFNFLNVAIALSQCYIKKANYPMAGTYIVKALKIDKNNQNARRLAKEIEEFGEMQLTINNNHNGKKVAIIILALIILLAGGVGVSSKLNTKNDNSVVEKEESVDKSSSEEKSENLNDEEDKGETKKEETKQEDAVTAIDIEKVQSAIDSENYDYLYEVVSNANVNKINDKDKGIYSKAKEILESKGVDNFYKTGTSFYENDNLASAKKYFNMAYECGSNNYLYPHIIFFNAVVDEKLNNIDEAIVYYEKYHSEFNSGDYIEETLYKLALLQKDRDKNKSILYANELRSKYPESIYNNDTLSGLLQSNN